MEDMKISNTQLFNMATYILLESLCNIYLTIGQSDEEVNLSGFPHKQDVWRKVFVQ